MSIIIIDPKSGHKKNRLTGEIIYGPTHGSLVFGKGAPAVGNYHVSTHDSGTLCHYRTFTSNKGFAVQLEPHEYTDNPKIAAERLARKYNNIYGHVDHVDASELVPDHHYAGQNQEFDEARKVAPSNDSEKDNFSKEDIEYLEFQNGYSWDNDGIKERNDSISQDEVGNKILDIDDPSSINYGGKFDKLWDERISPLIKAQLENPELTHKLNQDLIKQSDIEKQNTRKRIDAYLDKHPERQQFIDEYNKHPDTDKVSEYDVITAPIVENPSTMKEAA